MGFVNHEIFIKNHMHGFRGPFLEIGSRNYGSTFNIRGLFPDESYFGVDMSAGEGVDQVLDLTIPFEQIDAALMGRRFGTIFCLSVLEHCDQPFHMAANITRLLEPGGCLYVSAPFVWKFHGYPSDYWRFTPEGIKKLFPELAFDMKLARLATDVPGDLRALDEDLGRIRSSGSWYFKQGFPARAIGAGLLRLLGRAGMVTWLARHRYVFPPTTIEMIGVSRGNSQSVRLVP